MTGLFPLPDGCPGPGHQCKPLFVTFSEWGQLPTCDDIAPDNLVHSGGIRRGAGTGNTNAPDPQCITALRDQDST